MRLPWCFICVGLLSGIDVRFLLLTIMLVWCQSMDKSIIFYLCTQAPSTVYIRLLEANYRPKGIYTDARTILVIHNLALQGVGPASNYGAWGFPPQYYGSVQWKPRGIYPPGTKDSVNVLKGAILTSDLISTVGEKYKVLKVAMVYMRSYVFNMYMVLLVALM